MHNKKAMRLANIETQVILAPKSRSPFCNAYLIEWAFH